MFAGKKDPAFADPRRIGLDDEKHARDNNITPIKDPAFHCD